VLAAEEVTRFEEEYPDVPVYVVDVVADRPVSRHIAAARGSLKAPLSDADIEAKLRELCRWGGSGCDAAPLAAALWSLDASDDAGRLAALAAGRD
jgi:hypothetical protein